MTNEGFQKLPIRPPARHDSNVATVGTKPVAELLVLQVLGLFEWCKRYTNRLHAPSLAGSWPLRLTGKSQRNEDRSSVDDQITLRETHP